MKIILLKDVAKIGRRLDVKDVADGHALNFLIPNGQAKVATPAELKKVELLRKELEAERKIQEDLLAKNLHEIEDKVVTIKAKVNSKGHLFAALHTADVVSAIKKSTGADVATGFIIMDHPIKEAGEHNISIKAGDKKVTIKLVVEAE